MKFGQYLAQNQFAPWRKEYLQYDTIKHMIREKRQRKPKDRKEQDLIEQWMESEYYKIKGFLEEHSRSLGSQLNIIENQPKSALRSMVVLDDLVHPLYELHDLARYLTLSITGFQKLLKSLLKLTCHNEYDSQDHKRLTCVVIPSWIMTLKQCHITLDQLLVRLADIKQKRDQDQQRKNNHRVSKGLPLLPMQPGDKQNRSVNSIAYYWVHPQHVFELKAMLLFYSSLTDHHPYSYTYTDNTSFDVYHQQLEQQPHSYSNDSVQFGWQQSNNDIQLQHIIDYGNKLYVINQLLLSSAQLDAFLKQTENGGEDEDDEEEERAIDDAGVHGHSTLALIVEPKRKAPDSLGKQLQRRIRQQRWRSTLTCTLQRTTFGCQNSILAKDTGLQIHIDTNIAMKKVDSGFGSNNSQKHKMNADNDDDDSGRTGDRTTELCLMTVVQCINKSCQESSKWMSGDMDVDASGASAELRKQQQLPEWLKLITERSPWIHAVPRFSLYVHGVAVLYQDQIPLLPWWLSSFDNLWMQLEVKRDDLWRSIAIGKRPACSEKKNCHAEQVEDNKDSKADFIIAGASQFGLSRSISLQPLLHGNSPPWHSHLLVVIPCSDNGIKNSSNDMKTNKKTDNDTDDDADDGDLYNEEKEKSVWATNRNRMIDNRIMEKPKKKNARWTKLKVEPKVFFANERTFLSWLQFCALLLTVSLNMINFGGLDDHVSRVCGGLFIVLTILMALYALAKYEFRAWQLLNQSTQYRFDDVYGPAVLCLLLVLGMLINIGMRLNAPPPSSSFSPTANSTIANATATSTAPHHHTHTHDVSD